MGREIQKSKGMKPQAVLTMPLLEGTDGVKKMSKSYGNYIALNAEPADMYGQVMSVSDELMWRYYDLISGLVVEEIQGLKDSVSEGENPRDLKRRLSHMIVARFHSEEAADKAQSSFIEQFSKKNIPTDVPTVILTAEQLAMPLGVLLRELSMASSSSEGSRLIKQGAVRLDDAVIKGMEPFKLGQTHVLQVGKRRLLKVKV